MRIAINGMGVAGPTLAYWLHRFGHQPVLIEKAPALRTGGCLVDFWGAGYDVAGKMGLIPELRKRAYEFEQLRFVNPAGKTSSRLDVDAFRQLAGGRYFSIERSEISGATYSLIDGDVETLFNDSIAAIEQSDDGLRVAFDCAPPRDFDLVAGADGLHSRVRDVAFGPIDQYETDLGLRIAAFEVDRYSERDETSAISYSEPGRQISRISKRSGKTLILLAWRVDSVSGELPRTNQQRCDAIRESFAGAGWEWPQVESTLAEVDDIYFDRVSQIQMPNWTNGRVALVGDAAACVSLLAGEGTGLAMAEAYVLAGEINRSAGDFTTAFKQYEQQLMPLLSGKQKSARKVAASFVPRSQLGIYFRDWVLTLLPTKWTAKLGLGDLTNDLKLPEYS